MRQFWFTEYHTDKAGLVLKINNHVFNKKSAFQEIDIFETEEFGKMLTLDGLVMTTERDEFIYHEMISHIPVNSHPNPENILVIGGGDGGTVRELAKYSSVKNIDIVEIDEEVVKACRQHIPITGVGFDNKKVKAFFEDGIKFAESKKNAYDLVIVDGSDPVGPAVVLYENAFYKSCFNALKDDGVFITQAESPFYNQDVIKGIVAHAKSIFPIVKLYPAFIPTYPSGIWCFLYASKKNDPEKSQFIKQESFKSQLKYYNDEMIPAIWKVPTFMKNLFK